MLKKIDRFPGYLTFSREPANLEPRHIAGLVETLRVFIDLRLEYLRYGLEKYMAERGGDLSEAYRGIEEVNKWKEVAIQKARDLYQVNRNENMTLVSKMKQVISLVQDYCQAVFMATESIQKVWGVVPDADYIVDRMYEYLYEIYPPLFPAMLTRIDRMTETEIRAYFEQLDVPESVGEPQFVKVGVAAGTEKRA